MRESASLAFATHLLKRKNEDANTERRPKWVKKVSQENHI